MLTTLCIRQSALTRRSLTDYSTSSDFFPLAIPSLPRATLKLEGLNPAGSIKFKAASAMLQKAEQQGILRPNSHIIESSSGNMGIALSCIAASRGYRVTIICDPNTSERACKHMRALGAQVVVVHQQDEQGGFLGMRLQEVERRLRDDPSAVWLNQYTNDANWEAHKVLHYLKF